MSQNIAELLGVWLLRSAHTQRVDTGEVIFTRGENPRGVLILHEGGRMVAIITPRNPSDAKTEAGKAKAYSELLAYSGRYRLEPPDRFVTDVDVSWLASWLGSAQGRSYKLSGDVLDIVTDPGPSPLADGAPVVGVLSWVRESPDCPPV
jgi:lipocalin-like protein